jgi:acyl-CoA synthetase (NDP forming)
MGDSDVKRHRLHAFFNPRSIALVGAAPDPSIIRGRIASAVINGGFEGDIYPISRSHEFVFGTRCYPSLADLPVTPELAIITVPAELVPRLLEECAAKGTRAALILSSGFSEQGDEEGRAREDAIREIARRNDLIVSGPNAEGFFNAGLPLRATFSPTVMDEDDGVSIPGTNGRVAIVSQSGGVGFAIYNRGRPKGLDVSHVVSLGNEVELNSLDVLDFLLEDPATDVIAMFVEGFKHPADFHAVALKARRARKPILVAKMGRSIEAARASVSHTASLAGDYAIYEAVFRHNGVSVVDDIEQLVDSSIAFTHFKERTARGKRVAVLTASGGAGIWLTDTCVSNGLDVVKLDVQTQNRLAEMMPAYGNTENPVDITAQGVFTFGYSGPLEAVAASPVVDMILVTCSMVKAEVFERDLSNLKRLSSTIDKPVLFCGYTTIHPDVVRALGEVGFPCTNSMPNACRALLAFAEYCQFTQRKVSVEAPSVPEPLQSVITACACAPQVLCEHRARDVLSLGGIDFGPAWLATTAEKAVEAFGHAQGPVALKIQSPTLTHKSDSGGVLLNIDNARAVADGFERVLRSAGRGADAGDIDGILVQPMAAPGVEVVVGVKHDRDFGPMIMVGLGGVFVELLGDVVFAPASLSRDDALQLIGRLEHRSVLDGVRGTQPSDVQALAGLLVQVGEFATRHASLFAEIDLNPVIVHSVGEGITIVDALMTKP